MIPNEMEDNVKLIEELINRTAEYGQTSLELAKLKVLDKASDVISSMVPHSLVFLLILGFMLFLNLGLALWLNQVLNNAYYGFFAVAAFYAIAAIILNFFMHKWLKRQVSDFIIKHMIK
jgi:hypothetical protein